MSGQRHAPAALYPRERPGTHSTGGWVGHQGRSGQVRKISPPIGIRSPDRPARSSVAIPTELSGPTSTINTITWWWDLNVLKFKSPPRSTGSHQASVPLHFPARLPAGPMFSGWVILSRVPSRSSQLEFQFHQIFEKLKRFNETCVLWWRWRLIMTVLQHVTPYTLVEIYRIFSNLIRTLFIVSES